MAGLRSSSILVPRINPSSIIITNTTTTTRRSRRSQMLPSLAAFPKPQYFSSFSIRKICVHVDHKFWSSFLKDNKAQLYSTSVAGGICKAAAQDGDDDEACELVNGAEMFIDSVHAYLLKPVKNNNGTGILLLSDVFGFEDSATRDFAYRVACNGYNVVVPDLFRGNPWRKGRPNAEFQEWHAQQNLERVASDILTTASWMANELVAAGVVNTKIGILGFCFGGGQLMLDILARDEAEAEGGGRLFATGVSVYGSEMVGWCSSSVVGRVKVPLLLVAGDSDPLCPLNVLRDVEKRLLLNPSSSTSRLVIFKDRGHDFAHRPQSPQEDADADKAFILIRNWFFHGLLHPLSL